MSLPITGPVPAFSNPPIEPQFYQPKAFVISDISLGITTTVTTTDDLDYEIGQLVRLIIPQYFGCRQLNGRSGIVIDTPAANQVEITINSSQDVDSYIASSYTTPAQIVAVGDYNSGQIAPSGRTNVPTNIPGSFLNISPN